MIIFLCMHSPHCLVLLLTSQLSSKQCMTVSCFWPHCAKFEGEQLRHHQLLHQSHRPERKHEQSDCFINVSATDFCSHAKQSCRRSTVGKPGVTPAGARSRPPFKAIPKVLLFRVWTLVEQLCKHRTEDIFFESAETAIWSSFFLSFAWETFLKRISQYRSGVIFVISPPLSSIWSTSWQSPWATFARTQR